jgi:hypothetical protein
MEIINVITMHSGIISGFTSFPIPDKIDDISSIVDSAERLFIEECIKINKEDEFSEEDKDALLDDGNFDNGSGDEVLIIWSFDVREEWS